MANPLFNFFGFQIKKNEAEQQLPRSVVAPDTADGQIVINNNTGSGVLGDTYQLAFDPDGQIRNEIDLVRRYRELSKYPEVAEAIEDIVNEAIVIDGDDRPVDLNLDDLKVSDSLKKKITEEFTKILTLLKFNSEGYEIFEQWYVDGKIYFHIILDEKHENGIKELRVIDPRKIKKIKNIIKEKLPTGIEIVKEVQEYYIYNEKGITDSTTSGVRLSVDSVVYCHSGLIDSQTGLIQSYLHKAIKPANQLKMLEEAVIIYRYTRAPERRVFYIDVGNLPKGKAEQYVTDMMNKFKNKLSYDAVTGELADSKRHLCLDMNTRVPLLDGRTLTLTEISEEMIISDKPLWAYSCDPITGKFVPGKITWAGVSRPNAQVMRITLDNGETITCTPDHKFPVWNKGFVKAEDLYVGESMVPHYTRHKSIAKGNAKNYEQIFKNETGEWQYTHRVVSNWKDSVGLDNEFVFNEAYAAQGLYTVHHQNINRFDNSPENLVRMNSKDHIAWHRSSGSNSGKIGGRNSYLMGVGAHNKSHPDYTEWHRKAGKAAGVVNSASGVSSINRAKGRKILSELMSNDNWKEWFVGQLVEGWTEDKRTQAGERAKTSNLSARGNAARSLQYKDPNSVTSKEHVKKYSTEYPEDIFEIIKDLVKSGKSRQEVVDYLNNEEGIRETFMQLNSMKVMGKQKDYSKFNSSDVGRIISANGYNGFKHLKESLQFRNHKIAKIEWLDERMDTGCLTIDGNEEFHDYHTFALSAGIYTQNQMMEDFWMPRRGDRSTEITTLPGGQGLGNLDDLDYFKDKLYHALNVPKSRFNADTGFSIGRSDTISRDEIKFQKFVTKLRNKFTSMFMDILRVQLISKGVFQSKDWEQLKEKIQLEYAKDNFFSELKENEVLNARLQSVAQLDPFVGKYISKAFIQRNVMRFTDEEMKQLDTEIAEERKQDIKNGLIPDPADMQPQFNQPPADGTGEGPQ